MSGDTISPQSSSQILAFNEMHIFPYWGRSAPKSAGTVGLVGVLICSLLVCFLFIPSFPPLKVSIPAWALRARLQRKDGWSLCESDSADLGWRRETGSFRGTDSSGVIFILTSVGWILVVGPGLTQTLGDTGSTGNSTFRGPQVPVQRTAESRSRDGRYYRRKPDAGGTH